MESKKILTRTLLSCIESSNINENSLLMLHVKLKNLKDNYKISYENISHCIMEAVNSTKPKNVIVPSFTYSFVKKNKFNVEKTASAVGKFSEIFRLYYSRYRTNDPMFSLCNSSRYKYQYNNVNYDCAFLKNSVWDYLLKKNVIILNFGLDHLIISLIHYIEYLSQVPYRKTIHLKGKIKSNKEYITKNYLFYARDLELKLGLDWHKIENDLKKEKILFYKDLNGISFRSISSKDLSNYLLREIKKNPFYLVKNNSS